MYTIVHVCIRYFHFRYLNWPLIHFFFPVLVEASGRQLGNGARETRDSLKDGELGSMEGWVSDLIMSMRSLPSGKRLHQETVCYWTWPFISSGCFPIENSDFHSYFKDGEFRIYIHILYAREFVMIWDPNAVALLKMVLFQDQQQLQNLPQILSKFDLSQNIGPAWSRKFWPCRQLTSKHDDEP